MLWKAILAISTLYLVKIFFSGRGRSRSLPPGPTPKPIMGNFRDLPPHGVKDWEHWMKHKDLYGPISSVTVLGQTIILVNDAELAVELLEKQSAATASRPRLVFASELSGYGLSLPMQTDLHRTRAYRKALHNVIGSTKAITDFHPLLEREVRRFLLRTLRTPKELIQHIQTLTGAIILEIGYGYTVEPNGPDPFVDLANTVMAEFSVATTPGTWLPDIIPALKYAPAWLPGMQFQQIARKFKSRVDDFSGKPYAFVQKQMARGSYIPSYLSRLLEKDNIKPGSEEELVARWSAASLYGGGSDTTLSSLGSFFIAMAIYPETQQKAQAELDRVARDRLPTFADRANLPYTEAVVKEVLRWLPVAPMALPHRATDDRSCGGYIVPKDALILPNVWGFLHDPEVYHDPMTFKPERFLGSTPEPDPRKFAFGFGRRVCPGKALAEANAFLAVAMSLSVFRIQDAMQNGHRINGYPEVTPGVISHPVDFEVEVTPRSSAHKNLILSVEEDHPWKEGDGKECGF
ncbi:cytochrome P450 [Aspergillus ambiguus]|uniref:cytochrome P450 n=1 Tax=Aspergillus ambiguus TaxID=176160 RepID=UPI003CCCFC3E